MPVYKIAFRPWQQRQRMRTTSVVLVACLNIGYHQEDKKYADAKGRKRKKAVLQAWIDPMSIQPAQEASRAVVDSLQRQYQRWQPRAVYQQCLDPTVSDVKRTVASLRRGARSDRVLFHYNGHGVPQPTPNGEIWVFNKEYTQYIPLSVFDLFMWTSSPAIYVLECPKAGLIIDAYDRLPKRHPSHHNRRYRYQHQFDSKMSIIIFAACAANETLPSSPDMPADLFTSCLTTPLKVALRWAAKRQKLTNVTEDMIDKIPGKISDRQSPLGELNWIFTAVTDAIAWTTLPAELFHHLFR
eukprot:jgi/Bigna1/37264/e_gw1.19.194.1